jgi:hypothetical protein
MTRPSRFGPAACARIVWASGRISPPPAPCRTRKKIRLPTDHAMPHSAEPPRNSASETIHMRLIPNRPADHPVSGMTIDSASMYPVVTHWIVDSDVCRRPPSVSIATLTIVVSRIDMMAPSTTTAHRRLRAGSKPASSD